MNENKFFPGMENDAQNNDLASATPVEPVVETSEVPAVDPVPAEPVAPVAPVMPVEPTPSVAPTLDFPTIEQAPVAPVSETLEMPAVEPVAPAVETLTQEPVATPTLSVDPVPAEPVAPVAPVMPVEPNTPSVTNPVEQLSTMETQTPTTPVVETPAVGGTPTEEKPKKKGSILPIIIAIIAVALIGFGVWFLFFKKADPIKLTTEAFDKFKANVTEIGETFGEVKKYDKLTQAGEMTMEFSSAYLASEDYEEYDSLVEMVEALLLEYSMGADIPNENIYGDFILSLDSTELFNIGVVEQDGKIYLHVLDKYIDLTDQMEEESTEQVEQLMAELEGVDPWYFYDVFTKAFADSLEKDDFEQSTVTITVDKKDVKTTKHELRITKNNAARIINSMVDNITKDEKVKKICEILELDLSLLEVSKEDFEYFTPVSVNFYEKGTELVKVEFVSEYEYEDYNDKTITDTFEMSYTFGKTTDVFEVIEKENGKAYIDFSVEITIGDKESKVEFYNERTKLATLTLKTTDNTAELSVKAEYGGSVFEGGLKVEEEIDGQNVKSRIELVASIDTVEYVKVVLNQEGTFEEKYNKVDVSDAVKLEDLTDDELAEIEEYFGAISDLDSVYEEDFYYDDDSDYEDDWY